ncbi:MAG TPA: HepT-like ribonuclease domain-containing protein [Dehalococcoidia bacterium]|nr:HepT-like ribonuclease domain-containing protein [Dehalococcoidia bacterium]
MKGLPADRVRLQHMLDAARDALAFTHNRTRADLDANSMLARALLHAIQEIGEAASRVGDAGRTRAPGIPWAQIVGMRHRLVHGYWNVNYDYVWEVVERDLPALIRAIEAAIATWPLPSSEELME